MKNNVKFYKYFFVFLYIIIFILCGLNYSNPDYHMYLSEYIEYGVNNGFETFFSFLMDIAHFFGCPYSVFLIIITIIILIINYYTIKEYTKNKVLPLICLIISPLALLIVQYRYFLAISIVMYGMKYILKEKNQLFKYYTCILISCLIHKSMIFFIILPIILKISLSSITFFVMCFNVLSIFILNSPTILSNILLKLDFVISVNKTYYYLLNWDRRPNFNGCLATISHYFMWLSLILFICFICYKDKNDIGILNKNLLRNFYQFLNTSDLYIVKFLKIYIVIGLVIPFLTIETTFERYYFYMAPMIYILSSNSVDRINNPKYKTFIIIFTVLSSFFGLLYIIVVNGAFYRVICPIFKYNYFFDFLKNIFGGIKIG